jgi:site-specific DNA-methyltransferase (adenine-specific)
MTEEGINEKGELVTDEWPRGDPDEGFGPVEEMNKQMNRKKRSPGHHSNVKVTGFMGENKTVEYHGSGDHTEVAMAEGFFYVPKPTRKERDTGLDHLETKRKGQLAGADTGKDLDDLDPVSRRNISEAKNIHVTVKPVDLMRYLVKMVTPPGGIVLDPFMGSGTTGVAAMLEDKQFIGIDMTPEYMEIASGRINAKDEYLKLKEPELAERIENGMATKEASLDDFFS